MPYSLNQGGAPIAGPLGTTVGAPFSITLVIDGLDAAGAPQAVVGDRYQVSILNVLGGGPAIVWDADVLEITALTPGPAGPIAELVFNAPAGFSRDGGWHLSFSNEATPGVAAIQTTVNVAPAVAAGAPIGPAGGPAPVAPLAAGAAATPVIGVPQPLVVQLLPAAAPAAGAAAAGAPGAAAPAPNAGVLPWGRHVSNVLGAGSVAGVVLLMLIILSLPCGVIWWVMNQAGSEAAHTAQITISAPAPGNTSASSAPRSTNKGKMAKPKSTNN